MKLNFRCIVHPGLLRIALGMRGVESSLGFKNIFYSFISNSGTARVGDKGILNSTWTGIYVRFNIRRISIYKLRMICENNGWRHIIRQQGNCIWDHFKTCCNHLSCHTRPKRHVIRVPNASYHTSPKKRGRNFRAETCRNLPIKSLFQA